MSERHCDSIYQPLFPLPSLLISLTSKNMAPRSELWKGEQATSQDKKIQTIKKLAQFWEKGESYFFKKKKRSLMGIVN